MYCNQMSTNEFSPSNLAVFMSARTVNVQKSAKRKRLIRAKPKPFERITEVLVDDSSEEKVVLMK